MIGCRRSSTTWCECELKLKFGFSFSLYFNDEGRSSWRWKKFFFFRRLLPWVVNAHYMLSDAMLTCLLFAYSNVLLMLMYIKFISHTYDSEKRKFINLRRWWSGARINMKDFVVTATRRRENLLWRTTEHCSASEWIAMLCWRREHMNKLFEMMNKCKRFCCSSNICSSNEQKDCSGELKAAVVLTTCLEFIHISHDESRKSEVAKYFN